MSERASAPQEQLVVHLDGLVVGPDQWLVLSPRRVLTFDALQRIMEQVPKALKGRVLIVDQMDMAAVAEAGDERG